MATSSGGEIGFGVFGYGFMAGAHLAALQGMSGVRAVAVCGPRLERASATAARFGVPLATTEARELLEHPGVDAVLVDTPDATHHDLVLGAAARGKHVFCEKPLSTTLASAREMVAAVERAGVQSMMGFSTRFSPLVQEVQRHIAAGAIGRPLHVHAQAFSAGLLAQPPRWSWRTDGARTGAGVLGDLGSHLIDLNHFLLGPTVEVMASLRTFTPELVDPDSGERHPHLVDDDAALLLRFRSGAHGSLALSRLGSVHADYPIGRRHYLVDGTAGGLLWENGVATLHPYKGQPVRLEGEPPLWEVDHQTFITGWARQNLEPFIEAIRSGEAQAPTLRDGLLAQAVIDAALCSASSGHWEGVQP